MAPYFFPAIKIRFRISLKSINPWSYEYAYLLLVIIHKSNTDIPKEKTPALSNFLVFFPSQISLKLFRSQINISIFGYIICIVKNTLEITLFIQKTWFSYFNESLTIFYSKKYVLQSDLIISKNPCIKISVFFYKSVAFHTRYNNVNNLLSAKLQLVNKSRFELFLHICQRIVNNDNNFLSLWKEAIRFFFDDVFDLDDIFRAEFLLDL